jgi:hypothetical protein
MWLEMDLFVEYRQKDWFRMYDSRDLSLGNPPCPRAFVTPFEQFYYHQMGGDGCG